MLFATRLAMPTIFLRHRSLAFRPCLVVLAAPLLVGCASYEPLPVVPADLLESLRSIEFPPSKAGATAVDGAIFDTADGLTADEAVAVALMLNPALRAQRAEAGIAAAQLVEAGLLEGPEVGWDAMDWIIGGTSDDALAGFSLMQALPRPGEISAREGIAKGRIEEVRWMILDREWRLTREVQLAFLDILAAQANLELNRQAEAIAERTHAFFVRSREVGAATALQQNLAGLELAEVQRRTRRLERELPLARQVLNALLGVPPAMEFDLQSDADPFAVAAMAPSAPALTEQALQQRPDLQELLSQYQQAEDSLRLAVAVQWPSLALGTGIQLSFPTFFRGNGPAIQSAWEVRERLRLEVEAQVHRLRREVHAAVLEFELTQDQVDVFLADVAPRIEESLRLSEEALQVGQATLIEILTAQRQTLDARRSYLNARADNARSLIQVTWISGQQIAPDSHE